MNFFSKEEPPRLEKQVSIEARVTDFIQENPRTVFLLVIGGGSISVGVIMILLYMILTPATVGGII